MKLLQALFLAAVAAAVVAKRMAAKEAVKKAAEVVGRSLESEWLQAFYQSNEALVEIYKELVELQREDLVERIHQDVLAMCRESLHMERNGDGPMTVVIMQKKALENSASLKEAIQLIENR